MARESMLQRGAFTFHGSYTSKILAARKEKETPGSFIIKRGDRYYVLKEKKTVRQSNSIHTRKRTKIRQSNPGTLIYEKITRIEGTKGVGSQFAGQKFFHNFKRPYPQMFGLPDGSLLIKSKK